METKKRRNTARSKDIKIRWSMVIVLSTTMRQNRFDLTRFSFGRDDDDDAENDAGAKETLFIDASVVESVAPVPVVPRRPKMLKF